MAHLTQTNHHADKMPNYSFERNNIFRGRDDCCIHFLQNIRGVADFFRKFAATFDNMKEVRLILVMFVLVVAGDVRPHRGSNWMLTSNVLKTR